MTAEEFLVGYPEFATAATGLVDQALSEAEAETGDAWGDSREAIVMLKCAARLAVSPMGRAARLSDGRNSVYHSQLADLEAANACMLSRVL